MQATIWRHPLYSRGRFELLTASAGFPQVLESLGKSWNLRSVLESPGKSWDLILFMKSLGKVLEFYTILVRWIFFSKLGLYWVLTKLLYKIFHKYLLVAIYFLIIFSFTFDRKCLKIFAFSSQDGLKMNGSRLTGLRSVYRFWDTKFRDSRKRKTNL